MSSRVGGRLGGVLVRVMAACVAVGVVVTAWTFVAVPPAPTLLLTLLLIPLGIVLAGAVIIRARPPGMPWYRRVPIRAITPGFARAPRRARSVLLTIAVLMWAAAMTTFVSGLEGQPVEEDGVYYIEVKGERRQVSKAEAENQGRLTQRTMTGISTALIAAFTVLALAGPSRENG